MAAARPVLEVGVVSEKSAASGAVPNVEGPRKVQTSFRGAARRAPYGKGGVSTFDGGSAGVKTENLRS